MPAIERSIDVDTDISAADHEWTEFMFRCLVGHYRTSSEADVEWSLAEDAEQNGLVAMAKLPGDRTRVSVRVTYEGDAAAEAAVGAHLERDLAEFKRFAETRG
jgi:uncharacterized membrane protein